MCKPDVTDEMLHEAIETKDRDPHQEIINFFCVFSPDDAKKFLDYLFDGLYSKKKWIRYSPAGAAVLYEKLVKLMEDCWTIKNSGLQEKSAILDSELFENGDDWMDPTLFCFYYDTHRSWNNFPCSLSKKEFINPYVVLKKVFKFYGLYEWREHLELISVASLLGQPYPMQSDVNILRVKRLFEKLIEAAYLIFVRALVAEKK